MRRRAPVREQGTHRSCPRASARQRSAAHRRHGRPRGSPALATPNDLAPLFLGYVLVVHATVEVILRPHKATTVIAVGLVAVVDQTRTLVSGAFAAVISDAVTVVLLVFRLFFAIAQVGHLEVFDCSYGAK